MTTVMTAVLAAVAADGFRMNLRSLRRVLPSETDASLNRALAALVAAGHLTRVVIKEYDKAGGFARNLFGGSAVCVRRRAYYAVAK
jgi:hypothetical protein